MPSQSPAEGLGDPRGQPARGSGDAQRRHADVAVQGETLPEYRLVQRLTRYRRARMGVRVNQPGKDETLGGDRPRTSYRPEPDAPAVGSQLDRFTPMRLPCYAVVIR
ncbi:MAG: hypothetical protein M3460_19255 [Actinomycetota bacterium]|nr:hypothetical protein [Actinomycetota bacterium]